ncbi:hypothetical protein PtrSN002B_011626 [Pyrenophora tritici-repentis]|uniref:Uncharacterized protein n=1 Tax=Pyrenophora tritici-repentis TaxID=45151 RepID=A0A2W1GRU8_9PLEO|nr:hypothetical protein PtrV1_08896 [Pyrenophora tritici-repentis]KAF7441824.1 hypothetical protein A1F99_136760 [Pyrenophora tritici-repentis]KAF7567827.1 hypothetical protein PtrM4_124400 [Pyrenophora tritici-repentis]KAG9376693.1 hypothetical protein A1F94_012293 [Pyrenophora tritici-repentis]KAI0570016.1 hypothetical protein Alg130_11392 [Pyrenophora tritici-repentis]
MPGRTRPIGKLATAVGKCSTESTLYGKCIFADYSNVHKGMCNAEFMKLKDCYLKAYKMQ